MDQLWDGVLVRYQPYSDGYLKQNPQQTTDSRQGFGFPVSQVFARLTGMLTRAAAIPNHPIA